MSIAAPDTWTIEDLSRAIRTKAISPLEITRGCLGRLEDGGNQVNAFITVLSRRALAAARKAESEILRGRYRGPLHGVPYACKDLFLTRGVKTTCGTRILADFVPSHDADAIERLDAAGAILVGKLNMHEFAFGPTSVNPHYGAVRNPWDPERIAGGSSGGSAAAVAASLAFLTIGTDSGGSIRIPASLCGVCGLKPTYGRLSRYGAYPLAWSMDHVGPFAATVRGVALAMNVLAGRDSRDPTSSTKPTPDYTTALTGDLDGLRLGRPKEWFFDRIDEEVRGAFDRAVADLRRLGARVSWVSIDGLPDAARAAAVILSAEALACLERWHRTRADEIGADVRARLDAAARITAADYLRAQRVRRKVQRTFRGLFERVDALITPQLPITAPRMDEATVTIGGLEEPVPAALTRLTRIYNLTGMPALTVGCGVSSQGMPIGLQVAARPFDEATVLRVGHAYERVRSALPRRQSPADRLGRHDRG